MTPQATTKRPNILLITADDMNWDAVGVYGCPTPDTTPHIDRLAGQGVRFEHSHVTIAVCQPSRSALMTGRYPHRSGGEGFHHLRHEGVPILPALLREAGYGVGILGKYAHSTPYEDFQWDLAADMAELGHGRNPSVYADYADRFLGQASDANQPFFLMLNSHDPHRPFVGNDPPEWYKAGEHPPAVMPSKVFDPGEVVTPGFLPDLPEVRREIAEYYGSVRRCDDTIGAVLDRLDQRGLTENTIVVFLSDNGMAFPFAKTNCYLNSTRTPWIMRWPGVIEPGRHDTRHMIGGVDLLPTLLDAVGIDHPPGMDGRSFLGALRGEEQGELDHVFTQFFQTAGKRNYPMLCVQNRRYGYIFNPWSNGQRQFRNESMAGRTMNAMKDGASESADIAERVRMFIYRVPEEVYDFAADPDALVNRIDDPTCAAERDALRETLRQWMARTGHPALEAFAHRDDPAAREALMRDIASELGGE